MLQKVNALQIISVVYIKEKNNGNYSDGNSVRLNFKGFSKNFNFFIMVIFIFTLGNSSDVFLLLKAQDSGLQVMFMPILWSVLHISKSLFLIIGGNLSDKFERKKILIVGWIIYAAAYLGFGLLERVTAVWVLFAIYGIYFGFTESVQKAIIADIIKTEEKRGTAYGIYNFVSQWAFFAGTGIAFISIVMATFINLE